MRIIGRKLEQQQLKDYYEEKQPIFLVVLGRRRVGKTFLIRETFTDSFCFHYTGYANSSNKNQLFLFNIALNEQGLKDYPLPNNWFEAFSQLKDFIRASPIVGRKVVFLDEMPWMDAKRSNFLSAFEGFWNGWASGQEDIFLIVCGSATSWITTKLFHNRGGLHNRVNRRMYIEPFTLAECEKFFDSRGCAYSREQVLEAYMVFGGVPYYLDLFDRSLSVTQNINRLCFGKNGALTDEYESLYASLFGNPEHHIEIIEALASKGKGLTRQEIVATTKMTDGGGLVKTLKDLEQCGFIKRYNEFKKKSHGAIYQLVDQFSAFHLRFMQFDTRNDEHYWINNLQSGERNAWNGFAFEQACFWHIDQIKKKLGISGVSTSVYTWQSKHSQPGAQIDLVLDRRDKLINLCEIKFSNKPYVIDKGYAEKLQARVAIFQSETGSKKAIHTTFISTQGLARTGYPHTAQSEVTLDDLFE